MLRCDPFGCRFENRLSVGPDFSDAGGRRWWVGPGCRSEGESELSGFIQGVEAVKEEGSGRPVELFLAGSAIPL